MSKARRNFNADFKLNICKSIREQGLTITQICRDNDLGQTAVHRWLKQYDAEMTGQAGIGLPLTPEQRRIRELEQDNKCNGQVNSDSSLGRLSIFCSN